MAWQREGYRLSKQHSKNIVAKADLQQVISDLNSLERSDVPATPAELMSGRAVRSSLPASGRRSVDLAAVRQERIDIEERAFMRLIRGRCSCQEYKVGDRDCVQDPITKTWHETGTFTGTRCHEGRYLVTSDMGAELLRNGKFLRLRTEQTSGTDSSEGSEAEGDRRVTFQETVMGGGSSKKAGGDLQENVTSDATNEGIIDNSVHLLNIYVSVVTTISLAL